MYGELKDRRGSMKKIKVAGEIGWDYFPYMMDQELREAAGDDVEIIFMTPGGSISKGIEINTAISEYKKENKKAQMIAHVIEANSMGSYFLTNPAFDLRTAEDVSIGMVHNPIGGVMGDYRAMAKSADMFERLASMFSKGYAKLMKVKNSAARQVMDNETWYIGGKALKDAGLVDEVIKSDSKMSASEAHLTSEVRYKAVMKKVRESEITENEIDEVVKMIGEPQPEIKPEPKQTNKPAPGGENNQEDIKVKNVDELKEKFPEIHAATMKAGADQEKEAEKERVKSLVEMKARKDFEGIQAISDRIDEGIVNGESMTTVELGIMALLRGDGNLQAAMDSREHGDINPPDGSTVSGEDAPPKSQAGEF
jgi:ATP-dependent protease ClpP protease subunit